MSDRTPRQTAHASLLETKDAIEGMVRRMDWTRFAAVVGAIELHSKLIVTGVGKSAIAARKIAATAATLGRQAMFVDPVGLFHGELGMLRTGDVVLMVSNSGETDELVRLLDPIWQRGATVAAIVGREDSTLGRLPLALSTGVDVDPFWNVPTVTAAAAVALGDALALALAEAAGYTDENLKANHPGGSIGRSFMEAVTA